MKDETTITTYGQPLGNFEYVRLSDHEHVLDQMRDRKNEAYLERNRLVALLARLFPSGIGKTAIEGWAEDWHNCVYIDTRFGQFSWHFHDSHAWLFEGLPPYKGTWDGHTTELKYERIWELTQSLQNSTRSKEPSEVQTDNET